MKKINILFLAEELRVGGAETYFYMIENNIDRNKFNFYSMAVNSFGINKLSYLNMYIPYSFSLRNRYYKILEVCKNKNINIIHANSLKLAFLAAAIKRKKDVCLVYTRHNTTLLDKVSKKLYAQFLNSYVDIVNVICYSEKKYLQEWGVNPSKIIVNYNGIDINKFPLKIRRSILDADEIHIGILARLDKVKNHKLFLKIAKTVHDKNKNTRFYIGGDGKYRNSLIKYAEKHNMEGYTFFLGQVESNEFLRTIDYMMLVSKREVFPMVIIEAMAAGCIVVAKNNGGISEMVDSYSGYILDGENIDEYSRVLLKSFGLDEYNKFIYARKKVEEMFTLQKMIIGIEEIYTNLYSISNVV